MPRIRSKPQLKRAAAQSGVSRFRGSNIVSICLLLAAIAIAYSQLPANSFIDFDDPAYITANPHIRSGLTVATWTWAWTSTEAGNWHPLTWISHALDVDLFGLEPAGHHWISLLIHALNAVLLYLLLWWTTRKNGRCLVVAAMFALHPLGVESVAWAAERKNLLCTLFFLLALAAYGWYARRTTPARYLWLALMFALGLSAKPMLITLPFVLLLLDFWPLGRVQNFSSPSPLFPVDQLPIGRLVLEKVPLLVLSVGSGIITLIAQSSAGAVSSINALPLEERIANAIHSYWAYMAEAFWPLHLVPFDPRVPLSALQIGFALLFLAAASAVVWLQRANRPYLIAGWLFYLGTLVPVIGLVQVGTQAMADRYTYIPMIGIFAAIVWAADDFAVERKLPNMVRVAVPALVLAILTGLTWRQVRYWHDSVRLWSYNLEITPDNVVAEDNLGIALLQEGKTEEALRHFYNANRLDPGDVISSVNVATDLLAHGRPREAIAKYTAALSGAGLVPMLLPNIHSNLGSAYLSLGDLDQARDHYTLALDLNPEDQVARSGLGKIEQQLRATSSSR